MNNMQALQPYAHQPLTHQLLMSLLKGYKRPNDKIHAWLNDGILSPVKKGLYVAGPNVSAVKPEPFLLANHILGPSYVSMDAALSYHGLIPERVFEISSMTTKASRKFKTSVGTFTYTHLSLPYYSFGIQRVKLAEDQYAMVASPEKALFDKIINTSGLTFRSTVTLMPYLVENLRIDEDTVREFDTSAMSSWLPDAPKKESLQMLIKAIEN